MYEIGKKAFFHFGVNTFTGMEWGGSIGTGGVSYHMRNDPQMLAEIAEKARLHAQRLIDHLKSST